MIIKNYPSGAIGVKLSPKVTKYNERGTTMQIRSSALAYNALNRLVEIEHRSKMAIVSRLILEAAKAAGIDISQLSKV